jgi:hypothetical protein
MAMVMEPFMDKTEIGWQLLLLDNTVLQGLGVTFKLSFQCLVRTDHFMPADSSNVLIGSNIYQCMTGV